MEQSSLLERCGRFSPIVGLEPFDNESILLDITGLAHLFGGEAALVEEIARDFARVGGSIRIALADTIGAAWAVANYRWEKRERRGEMKANDGRAAHFPLLHASFTLVPSDEARDFLAPLPIEALRLPEETVRLLHELGIRQIGQVETLPREELLSRFSDILRTRLDQALGRLDEPVPARPLPPTFVADWSPEYPAVRRETIEAALGHLIRRVAAMLALCGRGALRLECRVGRANLSIGLFQPTAAAEHLFQLILLQLDRLRLPASMTDVHVEVTLTAPLERRQAMLFDFSTDGVGCHPRRVASLVERLSSRLGAKAVVGVRLRPEAQPELSWHYDPLVERRQRKSKPGTGPLFGGNKRSSKKTTAKIEAVPLPPRPLRLLPRPLPLRATSIVPGGPPLGFEFAGQQHRIVQTWGPERIETGWWRGRPVGRDYFRAENTTGRRFWLFRRLRDGNWFLHGMFE